MNESLVIKNERKHLNN